MIVYRIVKSRARAHDLSGLGAFLEGGRWNSEGVYALYASENPSLALLELLVHLDPEEMPPGMFVMEIAIARPGLIHPVEDADLPADWKVPDNLLLRKIGDRQLRDGKCMGIKVRSAVMPSQFNFVLNPRNGSFARSVRVGDIYPLDLDRRLKP